MADNKTVWTRDEWIAEGERRFGPDRMKWKFVCPVCGYVQTPDDYIDSGAKDSGIIAFSCVGRLRGIGDELKDKGGPCNYAGGGLFRLNPWKVIDVQGNEHEMFAFADK